MKTALIILLIILGLILLWFVVAVILEIRRRRRGIEGILVDKAVDNIMTYWDKAPSPRPKNEEESVGEETWKASDIDQEPIVDKEEEDLGLDERFDEVARFVVSEQTASRPVLQRILALGYHRAGCILEQLEEAGIVGPENEGGEREVVGRWSRDGRVQQSVARADDPVVSRATDAARSSPQISRFAGAPGRVRRRVRSSGRCAFGTFGHRLSLPAALQTH